MFLKLTYWYAGEEHEHTTYVNMDRIVQIVGGSGGSVLSSCFVVAHDKHPLFVRESPEELMEMMDAVRYRGCREVVHELADIHGNWKP